MMFKRFLVVCILLLIFSISYAQNGSLAFTNLFDNTDKDVSCYRIPSIITALNGDLIVAVDQRVPSCKDLKWNRDINIVLRHSNDNGNSWSDIKVVVDYEEGKSASDPSMIVDKVTKTIFLFFNYMDLDNERDVYYLKFIKSDDNGKTWSPPIDITSQITKDDWHNDFKFITSGKGTQTASNTLLHTLVNLEKGLHVFGSDNHGKSWYLIDIPIKPANESKIIELSNGDWMINSRVDRGNKRFVHISKDSGKSWSSKPDTNLTDPKCNAAIIRYDYIKDGKTKNSLLFSNINNKEKRENITLRMSLDEGITWTKPKSIYKGPAAYSDITILKNSDIGLCFEKDNYQSITFVRVPKDWLIH